MSLHLAVIHPNDLLGDELRQVLGQRPELWHQIDLLTDRPEEVGILTDIGGAAAMVKSLDEEGLAGVDAVFFAGRAEAGRALLPRVPEGTVVVFLAPESVPDDGHPLVAGVNLGTVHEEGGGRRRVLLSPYPGAVALALLLAPLRAFGLRRVSATLLQPVSSVSRAGLDEMLEQARSILAFAKNPPRQVFSTQMVFNIIPADPNHSAAAHLRTVLELPELPLSVQVLQASVFHSYGISLHVELENDPGLAVVEETLEAAPHLDRVIETELLGPIDAANREEILLGPIDPVPEIPGTYQIWAVMDNLTRGGALNAVAILEAATQRVIAN